MLLNKELLVGIYDSTITDLPFWTFNPAATGGTLSNFSVGYNSLNSAKVLWGDGSFQTILSGIVYNRTYSTIKTGITLLPFDLNRNNIFSKIICGVSIPPLSGSVDITRYNNLNFFSCTNNQINSFTGNQNLTQLQEIYLNFNSLSGSIPSLSGNTSLQRFECYDNKFTGFAGSVSNTLDIFRAQNNQLTTNAVNNILAAFVAANRTTGNRILNLGGTGNAAPSGQGVTNYNTLLGTGWTVTIN